MSDERGQEIGPETVRKFTVPEMRKITAIHYRSSLHQTFKDKIKQFYIRRINLTAILKFILVRFQCIELLSKYKSNYIFYDFLAGSAVGFVHIAQGLAYGNLAGVNTANGLYVSLFAPIFYAIFGGSRHLSLGTIAVMSLLIKETTDKCVQQQIAQNESLADDLPSILLLRTEIATSLALVVGIALIVMAILRCGVLSSYLTDALVSGYLCAAGVYVLTSQIPPAFGFSVERASGFGVFFKRWYYIFKSVHQSNPATVIVFVITVIPLSLGRFLNKKYIKYVKIVLPLEVFAIVIATIVCSNSSVNTKYNITSIGLMPSGLPKPTLPPTKHLSCIGMDFLSVAIVTIAMNFSIAARYADTYGYRISMDQELFAYGITNILISFFACFPACGAISRTAVGATNLQQSQLASVVSSLFLVIITYTLTSYLQYLPHVILASIVIVSIVPTVLQVKECFHYWRITRIEGLVWMSAFLSTLILDVDTGLFMSIVLSLLLNTITIQRPAIKILGRLPCSPNVFLDKDVFSVNEIDHVKIILMEAPLVSYNAKYLKKRVWHECGYDWGHNNPSIYAIHQKIIGSVRSRRGRAEPVLDVKPGVYAKFLILDCSMMFAIDSVGLQSLLEIDEIAEAHGTRLMLCGLREQLLKTANKTGFFEDFDELFAFLTVQEAVEHIEKKPTIRLRMREESSARLTAIRTE
ncbi:hypothetical protein ACOME3_005591 [Neoechinorhynchus agilis]